MNKLKLYYEYKKAYYEGKPLISDLEFDLFEAELLEDYPNLRDEEIGWEPDSSLEKFEHPTPMTSLNKENYYGEQHTDKINQETNELVLVWMQKHGPVFTASPKYDGNAVNAIYKNGNLWKVLSRGNGIVGRDYTNKFAKLPRVLPAEYNDSVVEFRGEALMPLDVFDKKYSHFKNARNLVAGILNKKDFDKIAADDMVIQFFDVRVNGKVASEDHIKICNLQIANSFPRTEFNGTLEEFSKIYEVLHTYKKTSPYYLDGFVLKVPENKRSSIVDGNPKDCLAIKFPPEESITEITGIEWTVGKTGELTPVLQLKPVQLDGTTVKKASAHNLEQVLKHGFIPGSLVTISKSGDIIPQARKVVKESNIPFVAPTHCPVCKSKLENLSTLTCTNPTCDAQAVRKLLAVKKLGIENIGPAVVENLFKAGIKKVEDFFEVFSEDFLIRSGYFKRGRALTKIVDEIESLKSVELKDVIYSLQFKNVGNSISVEYAKKITGIPYDFTSMDRSAIASVDEDRINNFIEILKSKNIRINYPLEVVSNGIKIEMTGSVNIPEASTKAEFLKLFSNVEHVKLTKDTDYLITDYLSSTSSKMKKAQKLGVKTITYFDFLKNNVKNM